MQCVQPVTRFRNDGSKYQRRCGSCPPCVIAKAAMWTLRIGLERTLHDYATFATLTYGPENLPANGSLSKTDAQRFFKVLRTNISKMPTKERLRSTVELPLPRYYFVGEYGEQSERPHYHAVLFGLGTESRNLLKDSWQLGLIDIKDFHPNHAAYVARYTTKKSFWQQKPSDGRAPEFSLMSKKPGLGHGALPRLADMIQARSGGRIDSFTGNIRLGANTESLWKDGVPESLRFNGKIYPLGPYLRDQLAKMVKAPPAESPERRLSQIEAVNASDRSPIGQVVTAREKSLTKAEHLKRMKEIRGQI